MDLKEARLQVKANVEAQRLYMKTIDDAEQKMNESYIEIPYELSIKLGMIDHYRLKHPDIEKTDEEILKYIEYLFDTYEDDNVFAKTRDLSLDLDEVILSLDKVVEINELPNIVLLINSILVKSGSDQKMRFFVEERSDLDNAKESIKEYILSYVIPIINKES